MRMSLKHARLELTGKGVKEQKETQQHETCPFAVGYLSVAKCICTKAEFVCTAHEHRNSDSDDDGNKIIIGRIYESNDGVRFKKVARVMFFARSTYMTCSPESSPST